MDANSNSRSLELYAALKAVCRSKISKTDAGLEWSQQGKYLYEPALTSVCGVHIPPNVDELTAEHVHSSRAREESHSG
jgi:hypothetical protein